MSKTSETRTEFWSVVKLFLAAAAAACLVLPGSANVAVLIKKVHDTRKIRYEYV